MGSEDVRIVVVLVVLRAIEMNRDRRHAQNGFVVQKEMIREFALCLASDAGEDDTTCDTEVSIVPRSPQSAAL